MTLRGVKPQSFGLRCGLLGRGGGALPPRSEIGAAGLFDPRCLREVGAGERGGQ